VVLDVLAVSLCDVEVELNTHGRVLADVHGGSVRRHEGVALS